MISNNNLFKIDVKKDFSGTLSELFKELENRRGFADFNRAKVIKNSSQRFRSRLNALFQEKVDFLRFSLGTLALSILFIVFS